MNFCHNCGGKLQENPKFCPHCGVKLNDSLVTAQTGAAQKEDTKTTSVKKKAMGRYIYPIVAGLVFILIFGSRALWTAYKNTEPNDYHTEIKTNGKGVKDLLLNKNWVLKSFSNLSLTSNNDLVSENDLKDQYNKILNDELNYVRFKGDQECRGEKIIQYEQSMDEEVGEVVYGIYAVQLSRTKGKPQLYWESNQVRSIGINSYVDHGWEVKMYKHRQIITELDENYLKCTAQISIETLSGEVWEYEVDVVYQAVSDDNKSTMVKANHTITDDWMLLDCDGFTMSPMIDTETNNRLEKASEAYDFDLDFDLSEAEFDYDEL